MSFRRIGLLAALGVAAAGAASAREPYDDIWFVKPKADAQALFQDRVLCRNAAFTMGDTAAAYSDPAYGAASAMGQALDSDALHGGGIKKRLQRAVFTECMKGKGWIQLDPDPQEAKAIARSSPRRPDALNAWLKAHEPVTTADAGKP